MATKRRSQVDGFFTDIAELVAYEGTWNADAIVTMDNGSTWRLTGNTGTSSQTPSQTGGATLTDANGNEFQLVFNKFINPSDLGAVESTDSSLAIQAALNASDYIDGKGSTFKSNNELTSSTLKDIQNLTLDFSDGTANTSALKCAGSKTDETLLTSDANINTSTVNVVDGSAYSDRDLILIVSDQIIDASNTNSTIGELGYIDTVVGNVITMRSPLLDTYTTAQNAKIFKITTVKDLTVYNVGVKGNGTDDNNLTGLEIVFGENVNTVNCSFEKTSTRAIVYDSCIKSNVTLSEFDDLFDNSTGYGISALGPSRNCRFSLNRFRECQHAFTTNNSSLSPGVTRFIHFENNEVLNSARATGGSGGDAIDTHAGAEDIYIISNTVVGSTGLGVNLECISGVIADNKLYDIDNNGIQAHNETDRNGRIEIRNNEVYRTGASGIRVTQGTRGTTAIYDDVSIIGNRVHDTTSQGIYFDHTNTQQLNYDISNNKVFNSGAEGIRVDNADDGQVTNNRIENPATHAIRVRDGKNSIVSSNRIKSDATAALIFIEGTAPALSDGHLVAGNSCSGLTGSVAEFGVQFNNNVTDSVVYTNQLKLTNGISLGTGTGNSESTNNT